jgi:hypothetical protein
MQSISKSARKYRVVFDVRETAISGSARLLTFVM